MHKKYSKQYFSSIQLACYRGDDTQFFHLALAFLYSFLKAIKEKKMEHHVR